MVNPVDYLARRWFDRWSCAALRQQFYRLQRFGDVDWLNRFNKNTPRLYVSTHASIWDGIVIYHVCRAHLRQPLACMIDAAQMREHRFFRRVGGFAVERGSGRATLASIDHAANLLSRGVSVVMFPQGTLQPVDERPLRFQSGVARIIERCPSVDVIPIALRYDFWAEQRGEALLHIGAPLVLPRERRFLLAALQAAVTAGADLLRRQSETWSCGEVLLRGRESISRWKDRFRRDPK